MQLIMGEPSLCVMKGSVINNGASDANATSQRHCEVLELTRRVVLSTSLCPAEAAADGFLAFLDPRNTWTTCCTLPLSSMCTPCS